AVYSVGLLILSGVMLFSKGAEIKVSKRVINKWWLKLLYFILIINYIACCVSYFIHPDFIDSLYFRTVQYGLLFWTIIYYSYRDNKKVNK
ncbi:MAG: hypothetical protein SNG38_05035, partial [Rikenellaceae bacterium]